jgi:peptidoglycan-associated lipoprotein
MKKALIGATAATLLAACASTQQAAPAADTTAKAAPVTQTTTTHSTAPTVAAVTRPTEHSVYFDFDNYGVKSQYDSTLAAHSKFAGQSAATHVRIEGNADERGSREYNLALGQKRAEAVKQVLVVDGLADKQIEVTSNGKEKPVAQGHDEAAWSQNRRADIVYP